VAFAATAARVATATINIILFMPDFLSFLN